MNEPEKAALVAAWMEGQAAGTGSALEEKNWWAIEAMMDLPWNQPELAWELILRIHDLTESTEMRAILAAGPLEDLMEQHGGAFIARVEELARKNPRFRALLRGAWLSENDKTEWKRFYAAAGIEQPHNVRRTRG